MQYVRRRVPTYREIQNKPHFSTSNEVGLTKIRSKKQREEVLIIETFQFSNENASKLNVIIL